MKKILLASIIVAILMIPVVSATNFNVENKQVTNSSLMQDFTHTVIVESGTATTCPYCVTAANQLYSIYNSGDLDFNYVALVWGEGTVNVRKRLIELGVSSIPDVYFDGGYKRLLGAQTNEVAYRTAITQSGERSVPDIDITPSVTFKSGGTLKIEVTVVNNEAETYNGVLKVYIVEKESRWNDYSGNPYHFAVLDIPIDRSLSLPRSNVMPLGDTHSFSKTWIGALYGFSDITADNIVVIAALFDPDTGYSVQCSSAEPSTENSNYRIFNQILIQRLANLYQIFLKLFSF